MEKLLGKRLFDLINASCARICEIRVRRNKPIFVSDGNAPKRIPYVATDKDIGEILSVATDNSVYAVADKLSGGFLNYGKGIRIGIAGEWVTEKGQLVSLRDYSSLVIRVPSEVVGCSGFLPQSKLENENILIVSPPFGGKTTLLRDMVKRISDAGNNMVLMDERGELSAGGALDVGLCTDVLSGAPKKAAFNWAVRTLSPTHIAMDELMSGEDEHSVRQVMQSGVKVIATLHGKDVEVMKKKKELRELIEDFGVIVELSAFPTVGTVKNVFVR